MLTLVADTLSFYQSIPIIDILTVLTDKNLFIFIAFINVDFSVPRFDVSVIFVSFKKN